MGSGGDSASHFPVATCRQVLAGHQDDTSEYVVTSFAPECVAHGPTFAAQALVRLALWRTQPPREWIPPQPQPRPPWHSLRFLAHEGSVELISQFARGMLCIRTSRIFRV